MRGHSTGMRHRFRACNSLVFAAWQTARFVYHEASDAGGLGGEGVEGDVEEAGSLGGNGKTAEARVAVLELSA